MTETPREWTRMRIFRLLSLLGDLEAQRNYERAVPIADVPAELVCMWFDDNFRPDELPDFRSYFSEEEFAVLSEFTAFFEARVEALPCSCEVSKLHGTSEWPEVVARAREVLARLAPEVLAREAWYPKE